MCTASWARGSASGGLIFNRDEQRSRPKAQWPHEFIKDGINVIAPIDEEAGGTWIAVNEFGFCAALLNFYSAPARESISGNRARSRGFVPLDFMNCHSVQEAADRWDSIDKTIYRPFIVLFWEGSDSIKLFSWDGKNARVEDSSSSVVTSSSYRTDEVEDYRRGFFRDRSLEIEADRFDRLNQFHFDRSNGDPAFNPLMSREDAITHNVSQVDFDGDEIVFKYWDRDFDSEELHPPLELRMKRRFKR